jgi:hypothetical protein
MILAFLWRCFVTYPSDACKFAPTWGEAHYRVARSKMAGMKPCRADFSKTVAPQNC